MSMRYFVSFLLLFLAGSTILYGREPAACFAFQDNTGAYPNGVFFYNKNEVDLSAINAVINNRKLIGWEPFIASFENAPANAPMVDLARHAEDIWAFYYLDTLSAYGTDTPTPDELETAFLMAGTPNKVRSLRTFLFHSPLNLDAHLELTRELHRHAWRKTGVVLNLDQDDSSGDSSSVIRELDEEADTNIWGDLVELIDTSFSSANWLSRLPEFFRGIREIQPESRAIHSPTMKNIYKRAIFVVENELENRQTDLGLWSMWQEMAQITGRRIQDFSYQLPPLPTGIGWAKEAAGLNNEWSKIIGLNWPQWAGVKLFLNMVAPAGHSTGQSVGQMPDTGHPGMAQLRGLYWERYILPLIEACLYSKDFDKATEIYLDLASRPVFIRETGLLMELANEHNHTFPQVSENTKSAHKAKAKSNIAGPFFDYSTPNADSLQDLVQWQWFLRLIIIEPIESIFVPIPWPENADYLYAIPADNRSKLTQGNKFVVPENVLDRYKVTREMYQMSEMQRMAQSGIPLINFIHYCLSQDKLIDYNLSPYIVKPEHSVAKELMKREGFSNDILSNTFIWGILDGDAKYHHGGNSRPSPDSILELLDAMKKESHLSIFRKFANNNPASITGKSLLLEKLQRIAVIRTYSANMNSDAQLNESDDLRIWGEFINVANATFPQILERPEGVFITNPFKIESIK